VAAVTGAAGYLGSLAARRLEAAGWDVIPLVHHPRPGDGRARLYDASGPVPDGLLDGVDLLLHCAYDFRVLREDDIWRVNVDGARRLLAAARQADVGRIVVVSSLSAYTGTTQLYGRAKLAIEEATLAEGGCVVRPGLVYGDNPGGMSGALRKLTRLPLVPLVGGTARQYPVHEDDLAAVLVALAEADDVPKEPVCVAQASPVSFQDLITTFAAKDGRRCRYVPVPWPVVYWGLRTLELLRVPLPFRADSLLGLVRSAPSVPPSSVVEGLGVRLRSFPLESPPGRRRP